MPRIEFHPGNESREKKLESWLEDQKKSQDVEHVIDASNGAALVVYRDRRLPTFIHGTLNNEGDWDGHSVFGEQETLDEIQEFIGEKGVIFERSPHTMSPGPSGSLESQSTQVFNPGDQV